MRETREGREADGASRRAPAARPAAHPTPTPPSSYKKTIVCQDVAKARNVCQVCLLDLKYGVPTQVRDAALGLTNDGAAPRSAVGVEYALTQEAAQGTLGQRYLEAAGPGAPGAALAAPSTSTALAGPGDSVGDAPPPPAAGAAMLERLARRPHYYERNKAKVCSFFAKGECKRGSECPYRHEMPKTGPLSKQSIKDRYYGVNDPVAQKVLAGEAERSKIPPPPDPSITTLFVGGLTPHVGEGDLRAAFSAHGDIASVLVRGDRAFVTFAARSGAEAAAAALAGRLAFHGAPARLAWGKPAPPRAGGPGGALYPSMDPSRAGAAPVALPGVKRAGDEGGGDGKRARG